MTATPHPLASWCQANPAICAPYELSAIAQRNVGAVSAQGRGQACLAGRGDCAPGLYCGPDSRCWNGYEGDPCFALPQSECAAGLYCGPNSRCQHVL